MNRPYCSTASGKFSTGRLTSIPPPMRGSTSKLGMQMVVTPPPKLPQPDIRKRSTDSKKEDDNRLKSQESRCSVVPAEMPLALPTTLGANMRVFQNWFVTKVAPIIPMKKRNTM